MKVPKGTSDYQASWIVDEEEESNGEIDEESSEEDDDDDDMLDEAMEDEDNVSQVNIQVFFLSIYLRHRRNELKRYMIRFWGYIHTSTM